MEVPSLILADLHSHSDNSEDGVDSVTELCENAILKKLNYLAVTDHCEIDLYDTYRYESSLKQAYFDMIKAQDVFNGQISLLKGVELGNVLYNIELASKVAVNYPYDFILGSVHHPVGVDDFAFLNLNVVNIPELMDLYFEEVEKTVDWGRFDSLAHITYPLRYINGMYKLDVDIRRYEDKLIKIFKKIIDKGIALEINVSGLRQPYGLTMPDMWCLSLYREAGGRMITVGSDSHTAKDVGSHITDGLRLARDAGFEEYCIFKNHEPAYIKIEL